jgi:hypothetical protein
VSSQRRPWFGPYGCVIAGNEAIQGRSGRHLDCHVAARLAMTDSGYATRNDGFRLDGSQ